MTSHLRILHGLEAWPGGKRLAEAMRNARRAATPATWALHTGIAAGIPPAPGTLSKGTTDYLPPTDIAGGKVRRTAGEILEMIALQQAKLYKPAVCKAVVSAWQLRVRRASPLVPRHSFGAWRHRRRSA